MADKTLSLTTLAHGREVYLSFYADSQFLFVQLRIPARAGRLPQPLMTSVECWRNAERPTVGRFLRLVQDEQVESLHVGSATIDILPHEREQIEAWLAPLLASLNSSTTIQAP
jgi:hypothetical protein